jgi:uncharacterized protein (TIGR02996 family)
MNQAAFLEAIFVNPYDDALRLAFADWLRNEAPAHQRDPLQAEFILLQLRRAQMGSCKHGDSWKDQSTGACACCGLRRREHRILSIVLASDARRFARFLGYPDLPGWFRLEWPGSLGRSSFQPDLDRPNHELLSSSDFILYPVRHSPGIVYHWKRGFPWRLTLTARTYRDWQLDPNRQDYLPATLTHVTFTHCEPQTRLTTPTAAVFLYPNHQAFQTTCVLSPQREPYQTCRPYLPVVVRDDQGSVNLDAPWRRGWVRIGQDSPTHDHAAAFACPPNAVHACLAVHGDWHGQLVLEASDTGDVIGWHSIPRVGVQAPFVVLNDPITSNETFVIEVAFHSHVRLRRSDNSPWQGIAHVELFPAPPAAMPAAAAVFPQTRSAKLDDVAAPVNALKLPPPR